MFGKEYLDVVLVPSGLLIVFAYHLRLLYRVLHAPYTTAIGFMNIDKQIWVVRIMQARKEEIGNALTVLSSSISTATFFASVSLTLSSLIGALLGNSFSSSSSSSSSAETLFRSEIIFGDTSPTTMTIKFTTLLASFLVAFSCFVQSTRYFVHANYLITTPGGDIPAAIVKRAVVRGGNYWTLGLRALYVAMNLIIWFFGPIPMFVSSVVMVIVLWFQDLNSVDVPLHHRRFEEGEMVKKFLNGADESVVFVQRS